MLKFWLGAALGALAWFSERRALTAAPRRQRAAFAVLLAAALALCAAAAYGGARSAFGASLFRGVFFS